MNVRLSILLVAILVLFAGTYGVIRITDQGDRKEKQPWLYKMDDRSIVGIEVTHSDTTINYYKKPGSTDWYIESADGPIPVPIEKWSGTTLVLSGPQVNRVLESGRGTLSEYGLDPPQTIARITERSGVTRELHLGYKTPDEANQYAAIADDPQLFTVPQVWALVVNNLAISPPYPDEQDPSENS